MPSDRLLTPEEPPAVYERRREGRSTFVITVDHASPRIPHKLNGLGLRAADLERHIAWDIGAAAVAGEMSVALDAPLVAQNYSRLVIDCNRNPAWPSSIPTIAETTPIPGNAGLDEAERTARRTAIFDPYHEHLHALLDEREHSGRRTILVAQHSMTEVFKGVRREMHAAVLYNRDRRFAGLVLEALRREPGLLVGDNEPYFCSAETDYTIPHHAEKRGLPYVEVEIRQDLILDPSGQGSWAQRIVGALRDAEIAYWRTHA